LSHRSAQRGHGTPACCGGPERQAGAGGCPSLPCRARCSAARSRGTEETSRDVRYAVAIGVKADILKTLIASGPQHFPNDPELDARRANLCAYTNPRVSGGLPLEPGKLALQRRQRLVHNRLDRTQRMISPHSRLRVNVAAHAPSSNLVGANESQSLVGGEHLFQQPARPRDKALPRTSSRVPSRRVCRIRFVKFGRAVKQCWDRRSVRFVRERWTGFRTPGRLRGPGCSPSGTTGDLSALPTSMCAIEALPLGGPAGSEL